MAFLKDELTGFVPTPQATDIIKMIAEGSSLLKLAKVEDMTSEKKKFNVLVEGPGAYWVGEGQRIHTSKATWIHPEIEAKKLAVIIPCTKEKLNDSTIDVFNEMRESIAEAFYKAIDAAGYFGTDSPFHTSIFGNMREDHKIKEGTNKTLDLDVSDAMATIEEAGFDVDGFVGAYSIKNKLRKLRDANGNQLYVTGVDGSEFYNQPITFSRNGAFDKTKAELIGGEWKYAIVGIREGLQYEILKEATLQDTLGEDGKPLSLAEQDMIAIKATMRLGFLVVKEDAFCAVVPADGTIPTLGELTVNSVAGTAVGTTAVTVSPEKGEGHSYKYKTGATVTMPSADQVCAQGYTVWDGTSDISGVTAGNKIVVVEVDAENKAKKAGQATIVVKTE